MSRLIYDDNLVSKFGLTIPNPIIEEVRIYDDKLECDVSIHIRLSQTEEENDIIINNFKSSGLKITIGNCDQFKFEEIKKSNNFFDLKNLMFKKIDIYN